MSSKNCHLNGIRRMRETELEESHENKKLRHESSESYANLFHGRSLPSPLAFPAYPANFTIPKLKDKGKSDMGKVELAGSLPSCYPTVEPAKFQPGSKRSKSKVGGNYSRELPSGNFHSAQTQNSENGNDQMSFQSKDALHRDSSTVLDWSISDPLPSTDDSGQESNPGSSDSPPRGNENDGWMDNDLENDDSGYDLHQGSPLEGSQSLMGTSLLPGTDPSRYDYESEDDQDVLIIGLSEEERLEIINGFPPTRTGF